MGHLVAMQLRQAANKITLQQIPWNNEGNAARLGLSRPWLHVSRYRCHFELPGKGPRIWHQDCSRHIPASIANAPGIARVCITMQSLVIALNATVSLVSRSPVNIVDSRFTSWNIDSSCNRGFHFTNFSNPNLRAAALGLAPSRLRFGGSGNDNREHGAC